MSSIVTVNGYYAIKHVLDTYNIEIPVEDEGTAVMLCELDKHQTFDSFVLVWYLKDAVEAYLWSSKNKSWYTAVTFR